MSAAGASIGKPQRTKFVSKSSSPVWDQDLFLCVTPRHYRSRRQLELTLVFVLLATIFCSSDSANVAGFILTLWEYHRIFPDVFLGIVTVRLNTTDVKAGHVLVDTDFILSKRKTKDKVSGTVHVTVQYKQAATSTPKAGNKKPRKGSDSSSSSSDSIPAPEEKGGRRQLNVSSKWAHKSNQLAQSGFVVVEEDSEDSDDDKAVKSPSATKKPTTGSPSTSTNTPPSRATKAVAPSDVRDQIALVVKMSTEEGSLLRDVEMDDASQNLAFALYNSVKDSESFVTLMVPDDPVKGDYMLFTNDGVIELGDAGSILGAMNKVLKSFATTNKLDKYGPRFPEPERPKRLPKAKGPKKAGRAGLMESFATNVSEVFDAQDEAVDTGGESLSNAVVTQKRMIAFVDDFKKLHGADSCCVVKSNKATSIRLAFEASSFISPLLGEVWDIDATRRIVIELELNSPLFMDSMVAPKVKTFQSNSRDLTVENSSDAVSFGLRWYLVKRIEKFLARNWPPKHTHLLLDLAADCKERVLSCIKNCVICDKKLEFRMLKPSICDDLLCKYSYDQYGLGADVASEIQHHPDVVDLLVSITYAASQGDARRFAPFPENVEHRIKVDGKETVTNFGTSKSPNAYLITQVLNTLPPINDLVKFKSSEELRAFLATKHDLLFPLLRWIITSNRAHLARLKTHEKITAAGSNLQFMFLSSPPEKERKFQQLKKKHGAFYAFHGSYFANWHAILRTGLRNLSNTELMSAGAVYGAGIYLAKDSGTSSGYAGAAAGWPNSMFNPTMGSADNYSCVALCEVINAGYKANPYYVVPVEDHVVTRYFFIYNSANYHQGFDAASCKPPKTDYEDQLTSMLAD